MARIARTLTVAFAVLAAYAPVAVARPLIARSAHDHPMVESQPATGVSQTGATLRARIRTDGKDTWYRFDYGTGTAYGMHTAVLHLDGKNGVSAVSAEITSLSPASTYHFRAVAGNRDEFSAGPDTTFTTMTPPPAGPGGDGGTPDSAAAPPAPAMGRTVVAAPAAGTVLVKEKGASAFRPLAATDSMPVGSIVDARQGAVSLSTDRGDGVVQAATFHGGMFQVRQSAKGHGMTDIYLKGGSFGSCPKTARSSRTASASAKRKVRRLWSSDHHGRFRTHGRNSVATVRGTSWYTEERCDGTLTRVFSGKVLVRERGTHRSKLVTRGHSFLARARH